MVQWTAVFQLCGTFNHLPRPGPDNSAPQVRVSESASKGRLAHALSGSRQRASPLFWCNHPPFWNIVCFFCNNLHLFPPTALRPGVPIKQRGEFSNLGKRHLPLPVHDGIGLSDIGPEAIPDPPYPMDTPGPLKVIAIDR